MRKWSPPGSSMMKTNFDGALFGESDQAGLGVVIRNSEGQVMAALSEKIQKPHSVQSVELLAARRAITFCIETGFQNSIFEGDSKLVIKLLRGMGLVKSQDGHIIKDILSYANSLQSFSFSHVSRQGNVVAHALAQKARLSFPLLAWMEFVPSSISSFVVSDLPVIQ